MRPTTGFGLLGMRERVELAGGELEVALDVPAAGREVARVGPGRAGRSGRGSSRSRSSA